MEVFLMADKSVKTQVRQWFTASRAASLLCAFVGFAYHANAHKHEAVEWFVLSWIFYGAAPAFQWLGENWRELFGQGTDAS
jgi:hypothetical protein